MNDPGLTEQLAQALFDSRRHGYVAKDLCWCGECSEAWGRRNAECVAKVELLKRVGFVTI